MTLKENLNYYKDNEVQIVELPYLQDSMSAVIFLPNENLNINDFISSLNEEKLQRLIKRMSEQIIELELPKFKLELISSLKDALNELGMVEPFGGSPDFSKILEGRGLFIKDVIQKAYLSVDEKGTKASAVSTSRYILPYSLKFELMNIDRPFLFMLRNKDLPEGYEMLFMEKIETL